MRRIIAILREQCPWDRVQTARDIVSYTVEEVYELADAIAEDDLGEEHGELGDLLMQVYFLAQLLEERDAGDVGTVAREIEEKLIRRHAHIFGDAVAETPGEVRGQWDRIKREQEGREGIFHDVPDALPALLLARKLQERAAAVGFDWETAHEAFPKIAEEHAELAEALGLPGFSRAPRADSSRAGCSLQRRRRLRPRRGRGSPGRSRSRAEGTAERSEPADVSRPGERRPGDPRPLLGQCTTPRRSACATRSATSSLRSSTWRARPGSTPSSRCAARRCASRSASAPPRRWRNGRAASGPR